MQMLMDDVEADRKKKKKVRVVGEQVELVSQSKIGSEIVERVQKIKNVKKNMQQNGLRLSKENVGKDQKGTIKEKKSARESFVCGACGQLGHMRTNKNCPKYGEDVDARPENADPERTSGKHSSLDQIDQPQPKTLTKKLVKKSATKIVVVEETILTDLQVLMQKQEINQLPK